MGNMCIVFLFGCCDNVAFERKDLEKHPWLMIFTPQLVELDGVHNIDNDYLRMSFISELNSPNYFVYVDSLAQKEGWDIAYRKDQKRVFIKSLENDGCY